VLPLLNLLQLQNVRSTTCKTALTIVRQKYTTLRDPFSIQQLIPFCFVTMPTHGGELAPS